MLNVTATMARRVPPARRLGLQAQAARSSTSPSPTRRRCGTWGAKWLVEHERDAVYADYVLTESGGFQIPTPDGPAPAGDGRRRRARTGRSSRCAERPGTASQPFRTDNALVTAAEVVRRLARVPARRPGSTTRGAGSSRACTTRPSSATPSSNADELREFAGDAAARPVAASSTRARTRRSRRRSIARRHEDERDPRPGRASRSTSARCPARPASDVARHAARGARRPRRPVEIEGNDDPSTASPDRHAAVGRALVGDAAGSCRARRWCRS